MYLMFGQLYFHNLSNQKSAKIDDYFLQIYSQKYFLATKIILKETNKKQQHYKEEGEIRKMSVTT